MMQASTRVSWSASSIRHGQVESLLTTSSVRNVCRVSHSLCSSNRSVCRVSHSLCSSNRSLKMQHLRRANVVVRMEDASGTTVTSTSTSPRTDDADSLEKDEGPLQTGPVDVSEHVALLKRAAKTKKVAVMEVFAAMRAIEKAKVDPSNFLQALGGTQSPGRTWMLVFTVGKDLVREAVNGGPGGGEYLPVSAIQNFDAPASRIENGVYLGPLGALAFEGRFSMKKRILAFLFDKIKIKVGILPVFTINIGKKEDEGRTPGNSDPFFIFFYADDEIIVAKGRGGGLAYWCRCERVNSSEAF